MTVLKILLPVLVIIALGLVVVKIIRVVSKESRAQRGIADEKSTKMLSEAAFIFTGLLMPTSVDDLVVLPQGSRTQIEHWMAIYRKGIRG